MSSSPPPPVALGVLRRVRVLGQGSYGVVHLGFISDMPERPVAVKTAVIDKASSLEKEKRVYQACHGCPNIVQCFYDSITVRGSTVLYNLVLEYASAGTLKGLISGTGGFGMPEAHVRRFAGMILRGLWSMHARGYVHCDVKPENILVFPCRDIYGGRGFELKLADLGLAVEPHEALRPEQWKGRFRGTPTFMSPESVAEGILSPALDIWSLGCTVVECLTGDSPWSCLEGLSFAEFAEVLVSSSMTPPVPESLSELGKDFLEKCFERDPYQRWPADLLMYHPFVSE